MFCFIETCLKLRVSITVAVGQLANWSWRHPIFHRPFGAWLESFLVRSLVVGSLIRYTPKRYLQVIWLVVWNIFYFCIYWEFHHPNWLSYFSEGLKPPTSYSMSHPQMLLNLLKSQTRCSKWWFFRCTRPALRWLFQVGSSSDLVKAVEVMSKCSAWRSASQSLGNAISEEQFHGGWIMLGTEAESSNKTTGWGPQSIAFSCLISVALW